MEIPYFLEVSANVLAAWPVSKNIGLGKNATFVDALVNFIEKKLYPKVDKVKRQRKPLFPAFLA